MTLALVVLGGRPVQATTITFDDLDPAGENIGTIPDGYFGFVWNSFGWINGAARNPISGYTNGTVSGEYVGFNQSAMVSTLSDTFFSFESAYITGAWNDGLSVIIEGRLDDSVIFSMLVVVDTTGPTLINPGWTGIDQLRFESFGGTNANRGGTGAQFAIDDLVFTMLPEPNLTLLLGAGLLTAASLGRKRRVS